MNNTNNSSIVDKKTVFICYSDADLEYAEWMVKTLEAEGHKCLYHDRDFVAGSNIVETIDRFIKQSDHMIIILSRQFLQDNCEWHHAERNAVLALDPSGEQRRLICVCIQPYETLKENLILLRNRIPVDLSGFTSVKARNTLLRKIFPEQVIKNKTPFHYPGDSKKCLPEINNITFHQNSYFTGRKTLLNLLSKSLIYNNQSHRIYLYGMGGIGKSEIAKEYVFKYGKKYEYVWWVDAEDIHSIIEAYLVLSRRLKLIGKEEIDENTIVYLIKKWMAEHDNWLLIFDNVGEKSKIEDFLPIYTQRKHQHTIITTRHSNLFIRNDVGGRGIPIDVFEKEEALIFFKNRTHIPTDNYAKQLSNELGYLPLALENAATYILNSSSNYRQYLELYKNNSKNLLYCPYDEDIKKSVFNSLDLSVKLLLEESNGKEAYHLFCLCSFFSPDKIPSKWLAKALSLSSQTYGNVDFDEIVFPSLLKSLKKHSFIKIDIQNKYVNTHRLLQEIVAYREANCKQYYVELCECTLDQEIFNESIKHKAGEIDNGDLIIQVSTVLSHDKKHNSLPFFNLSMFLSDVCIWNKNDKGPMEINTDEDFFLRTLYNRAKEANENAISSSISLFGKNSFQHLYALYKKGVIYNLQGEYNKSRLFLRSVQKYTSDSHLLSNAIELIGTTYREQGYYKKALSNYEKALHIKKEWGKDSLEVAKSYSNIGLSYLYLNDFKNARINLEISIEIIEKKSKKPKHIFLAQSYNNLGELNLLENNSKEALFCHIMSLNIRETLLGKFHVETANSYNNIGRVYAAIGNKDLALQNYKYALSIYKQLLGEKHSYTGIVYHNMGRLYLEMGDKKNARSFLVMAKEIYNISLPSSHKYIKIVNKLLNNI